MKTKIKRHSRSVISVILALSLILTSSVAAMFVANAVTLQDEKVGAKVVEEGEVGVSVDDDSAVGATTYGVRGSFKTNSGGWESIPFVNNEATVDIQETGTYYFGFYSSGGDWYRTNQTYSSSVTDVYFGTSGPNSKLKVEVAGTYTFHYEGIHGSSLRADITFPAKPDVCTSISIAPSKTELAATTETFTLTADAVGQVSGDITYTFKNSSGDTVDTVVSNNGRATTRDLTQSGARTMDYYVTASKTGNTSKTSATTTVTNNAVTATSKFAVSGLLGSGSWQSSYTSTTYKINTAAGDNVFYTVVPLAKPQTTDANQENKFRLIDTSNTKFDPDSNKALNAATENKETATAYSEKYFYITYAESGNYRIYVDQTDASNPVVWVTEDNPICTSVTLSSDKTGVDDSTETFTLTATVTDAKEDDLTYTFYDENDESVAVITSSTGSASVTTTLDAASHTYRVVVSGSSSYGKKTSNTVKVCNYDLTEPVFAVSGLMASGDWPNTYSGCTYKVNTPAGRNVFYTKATFSTATTSGVQANKFRLRRSGDDKAFSPDSNAAVNASTEAQVTGINKDSTYFYATNVSNSKTYRIYVDQTDVDNPKVWITEDRDIYITSGTSFYTYVNDGLVTAEDKTAFETAATYQGYSSGSIYSSAAINPDKPFMLSTTGSVEYDLEYDVRTDLCTGVTLTEEHVMVGHEEDGHYAWIYKIKSNVVNTDKYTKNIILHIDKKNKKIWATATIDQTAISDNTYDNHSTEKVRYYFAQQKDQDAGNYSDNLQNGVMIKYWNNSLKQSSYSGTVTMKTSDGSSGTYGYIGSIYVDLNQTLGKVGKTGTYSGGSADTEFNLYYCDLPIWATTFQFRHYTDNKAIGSMCYALNPNRVYLMWGGNDPNVSAVVLDSSLSSSSTNKNFTDTQNFTANIVKLYNIDNNPSGEKTLDAVYRKDDIRNALYFGEFNSKHNGKYANLYNFKLWNNLAQRKDENKYDGCSYNAITWGLAGSVLNLADTATNPNAGQFYSIQDTDNNAILPFFDYKNALSTQVAKKVYTNTDFPFYKSTYDGITYYSYDSLADPNRQINSDHKTYSTSSFVQVGDFNGFAPFGSSDAYATASEFDINFYMTSTGSLVDSNNKSHDIVYNFSGDDDVWVYIDGVKVLDLGGDHMISAASINLTDMKVYYKTPAKDTSEITKTNEDYANSKDSIYTVDLDALFKAYGVTFSKTNASVQHKLQMFYVERGEGESNFSASFNLPQNSGLRIQNEIDTSEVNNGLVDATLWAANHDYFQYYVANSLADADQYNSAKTYYGLNNLHSAATGKAASDFYTNTPAFPVHNTSTVNRVTQGITQLLLKNGISGGAASAAPTLASGATDFGLAGINYELTDAYTSGDIDSILSGTVRTIAGDPGVNFNLLYDQAAVFDSKITPNTWLVVKQQNELYLPTTNNGSYITRGDDVATGVAPEDQRNASRFYTTTFTITDDAANKVINTRALANNMETAVVAHSADNEDGYYFANYSDKNDDSLSVAATYKFVNKPNTGTIKVTKQINAGNETPDLTASFWFDVTFDNVFGVEDGDETFSPYNIKYKVYNTDGTYVERNYDTTNGIMLRHGQTAEITGIPSGTLYKVIERSRGGYNLDTVVKTSYRNGVMKKKTTMTDSQQYEKASDIDYMASTDVGDYLATFEFTNKKTAMKVVLHYYDRKMQNGVPVDIDTTPTTATVAYQNAPSADYEEYDDEHNLLWVDTEGYIANAVEGKLDNVVDKYSYWTTNTKAKAGIQTKQQISYTLEDGTYKRSLTDYPETPYHLDAYGLRIDDPQPSDRWITYYDNKGNDLTDQFTDAAIEDKVNSGTLYNKLSRIDVWVFNEPKEYTVTVFGAANATELTTVNGDGSVMVGTGGGTSGSNKGTITDYYNTRFGETAGAGSSIDYASNYMKQYGRQTSFTGQYPTDVATVQRVIGDYKFVGWATDPDGKNIYTNDYYCGYRILSDMSLYPVYMKNPTTGFGLTITPNVKDTYIASNGTEYTRLNVTYNPYNVTGDNDANITEIAQVIIRMKDDFEVADINLATVRDKVKAALVALQTSDPTTTGAHTILVDIENTKKVRDTYNANEVNYKVTFGTPADNTEVKLNNKNRVMLTQTYNSSLLATGNSCNKLLCLGAMKYNGEWTISTNYLYYLGGECR